MEDWRQLVKNLEVAVHLHSLPGTECWRAFTLNALYEARAALELRLLTMERSERRLERLDRPISVACLR